jgi:hypothetical protein
MSRSVDRVTTKDDAILANSHAKFFDDCYGPEAPQPARDTAGSGNKQVKAMLDGVVVHDSGPVSEPAKDKSKKSGDRAREEKSKGGTWNDSTPQEDPTDGCDAQGGAPQPQEPHEIKIHQLKESDKVKDGDKPEGKVQRGQKIEIDDVPARVEKKEPPAENQTPKKSDPPAGNELPRSKEHLDRKPPDKKAANTPNPSAYEGWY